MLNKLKADMPYKTRPGKGGSGDLAYIDARQVMDRLDEVCGVEWSCDYKEVKGNVFCTISLFIEGKWVGRTDCGVESNFDKEKGQASDAFKRAAVKWGVGRFLYSIKSGASKPAKVISVANASTYVPPIEDVAEEMFGGPTYTPVSQKPKGGYATKVAGETCGDCKTAKYILNPKTDKIFCEDKCWTK